MTENDVMTIYIDKTQALIDKLQSEPVTPITLMEFQEGIRTVRKEYKDNLLFEVGEKWHGGIE